MEKVLKLYKYIDGVNDTPFPNEEEQLIVRDFRYDAKRMGGAPTITFNAMHRLCLDNLWGKEVYATFNGERYYIKQTPTSSYSNSDTRYKHDVELVSERAVLDNIYFYDVVTGNNGVDKPVSNSSKFTFFGDIEEYANRLNYSLKWSNVDYSIVIDEGVTSEEKQVTFEDQVVTNALQEIYNIYQIPYYFVGKVIHVGEYQNNVDHVFKYGATNSLLSISKNNSNAKIVNRITGVGSQDNIPYYYPNDDEKGVTRPLLNGSSRGVSISNQSRYRKVRLSDTFVFHNTIQTQTPLIDSSIYTLGDLTFDKKEEGKDAQYSVDFYYTFSLKDGGNVLFNVSTDDENTVDLRYEIYKTSGNHLGFFKGENTISLTGGESSSYNFIIRWTFLNPNVLFGVEEQLESLISSKLNIAAYIVVDEEKTWTLKNIPISLDSYGLKVDNPSDGDVITIQQVSYINPQPFLMPPIYREEEGRKRFYNAKNNEYENVEGGGYYVFENEYSKNRPSEHIENFDDIKPTIKNVTNSFGQRIDSFVDFAYDLNDNDEVDEEGKFIHKYFFAKLRRFDGENGFNLFDHAIDESEMIISMTSGSCGSCSFKVMVNKDNHKNTVQVDANGNLLRDSNGNVRFGSPQDRQNDTENYEVWIALEKDIDTFGVLMPNATNQYRPSNGDTFVILHIDLPKAYIEAAEKRLEDKLIKYMYDNNFEKFNFSIAFSRIFFAENQNILDKLNENSQITIEYNGHEYSLYASSISITMSKEQPLPEIKVELNENISISQNQISQIVESTKKDILSKTTKDVFWGDIKGVPSWIGSEKPRYSYSELSGKVDAPSEFWKLKSTEDGEFYIHTTYPVVTQQGVTMYSDSENLDLPTIYDGLPIDNDTIYWEEIKDEEGNVIGKRIKARGGSGEGGITPTLLGDLTNVGSWANAVATEDRIMVQRKDSSSWTPLNLSEIGGGSADFSNVLSSGNGNAFTSFVLSEDKKTLTFVKGLTFAEKSDSLSGYGITDAYTKTEVDGLVEDYLPLEGGTIQGDVRLRTGNEYTSPYLYFGDGNEVYLVEETDSYLTIHADRDILLTTGSNYTAKLNGKSIATEAWVTNKGYATASDLDSRISALVNGAPAAYDTLKEIADVLQGNVNSIGDIVTALGGKADKATTLAGYGITDAKISNGVITLGGNTITPLTSHQTIYNLTLKAGTFSATTFDPNGEAKTVNIPTTTSHISEGDNLYFTNARAVSALSDTLKAYVTLSGTQTITGEKDFTGGLKVNGSQIVYDKTNKYWKLTGDLVVTGGITMFANDGTYTPSTITDAVNIDNQTIIRQNGKLMVNPELTFGGNGGGEVSTVAWGNIIGTPSWITDTKPKYSYTEISGTPDLSVYALSTSLNEYQTKITSTNKLSYSLIDGVPDLSVYALKSDLGGYQIKITESSKLPYSLVDGTPDLSIYVTKGTTLAHYGIADAKISNGAITLGGNTITPLTQTLGDARYVTALGTSGNDLTWTKNGNTNKITVPYATHSAHTSYLRNYLGDYNSITDLNEPSTFKTSQYRIVYDFYDGNTANRPVTSNNASGVLTLFKGIHRTGGGQYMSQMAFPDKDAVYLRRASDGVFGEWKQIAFTDSDIIGNAATATALKNPKTLWGQSFDGTENVSGDMTGVGSLTMDGQLSLNGITIKKSASGVLFVDGNLVVSGGVTMYGTDGTTSTTIWDNAPIASTSAKGIASFDPNYFAVNNGKVTFIGQTGGGIESITKQMVIDALGYTPYSSANPSGYITGISKSDVTTALGFTPYDASNPNNYVTSSGTVANATNLTSYKAVTFTKSDNGGKPCYMLIADVTSWYSASASVYEWGIAGIMYGWRGGNLSGTCVQKMIAMCSYNKSDYELKSDVITYIKPRIVSYGGKYYIALYMAGSGRSHYFIGKTSRLLDTFIEVACDSNGNCDGLAVVFDAETMSMNGASVGKLTTKRKIWGQDFDGSADVSGSITGATTGSFSGNVSMASATINGGKLTYNSTDKYWKLEGDLLVTGGVTMFGSDSSFNPSTITQAVNVDGTTIINDGTKLMLNPNIELGGGSVTDYNDLTGKPDLSVYALKTSLSSYQTKITSTNKLSYSLIDGIPTSLKNPNPLSWSGYTSGSYDGSSAGTIVIPSNTNQLTNGAGFITSSGSITGNAATATTASKLSIVSKTAWGQTYWTSGGIPTSISGDMTGVGTINSAITINSGDDSAFIKGSGHKMYFGGSGYANQSYYFRPLYGASGATATNLYIQNASAASSPTFTTTHSFLSTGNATHSGTLTVGKSITSGGSVLPSVGGSHSIGSSSNLWKDMWASNVKYTDSIYLGFTDSYIGFRVGGSGSQLIVDSTSVRTNSSASARASLGKYSVPWNGIYLGIDSSAANNKYGVNFSDASGYIVGRLGSSSSGLGMYSKGSLYLRGGCTSSSDSLTASKTGLVIDESGDVTISGNLLVSGGITMYATNNDNGFSGDFLPNEDVLYNLGSEEKRWKSLYSGNADFNDKIVLSGETGETCNITFQRSHSYVLFNGIGASSGSINFGTEATGKGTVMRIANSGRVGINTYQPEQALHVVGNIKCTGTLSQGSDIRYKEIHKELSISLATMADAPSIEYHFTDDESKSIHVGTSAQYWQSVNGVVNEGEDGRLGMDYSSLGVVMGISLAKELSRYESGTDKEIQTLKKRIGELEEEIENLKNK